VFVYEKVDEPKNATATLQILHTVFIEANRTADFTITRLIRQMLKNGANADDLVSLMTDRHLPLDGIEANAIAEKLLKCPPEQGYLTISNALQWRLQYARVIEQAGKVNGILDLR